MKLYSITEGNILLIENQQEYLQKKYPDISPQQIQQAIDLDRRNAEKLILGLKQGIIDTIQPESIEAVAHLDPFAKTTTKSETEIAYDNAIKEAKKIHPKYWQWIIRIKKTDPQAQIDEGIFHYLEAEGLKSEDIIDKTLEQITQASTRWHDEQFKDQQTHGQYTLTPEKDAILTIDAYAWVPVEKEDELTEGAKMGNCIGRYCKTSDTTKIYSLRNKYNNPHVSLSIIKRDQIWALSEIKGKSNKTPIDKYIPYIQKFCVYLFKRGVKWKPQTDFASIFQPELHNYIDQLQGTILHLPDTTLLQIDDDTFNRLILQNGLPLGYPTQKPGSEQHIKRLTPQTIMTIVTNPLYKDAKITELIKKAIIYGRLNEEQSRELLTQHKITRGTQMFLTSRFHPQEFLTELKKINPEDLRIAFDNYRDAIEAYPTYDSHFGILLAATENIAPGTEHKQKQLYMSKTPTTDLENYYQTIEGTQLTQQIYEELIKRALATKNQDEILRTLQYLPQQTETHHETTKPIDIALAFDYDRIPEVYKKTKHNPQYQETIATLYKKITPENTTLSGTTPEVSKAMQQIMDTNDIHTLEQIRRQTKSRGVKIMATRKIARINRPT